MHELAQLVSSKFLCRNVCKGGNCLGRRPFADPELCRPVRLLVICVILKPVLSLIRLRGATISDQRKYD